MAREPSPGRTGPWAGSVELSGSVVVGGVQREIQPWGGRAMATQSGESRSEQEALGTQEGRPSSPSRLARRLRDGHIVVTAEINPPRHAGAETVRSQARLVRGAVDAVNLTDCTRGI